MDNITNNSNNITIPVLFYADSNITASLNCSDVTVIPTTSQYLQGLSSTELAYVVPSVVGACLILIFCAVNMAVICRDYVQFWRYQQTTLWILSTFPVITTLVLIKLIVPRVKDLCLNLSQLYAALIVWKLFRLFMETYGGYEGFTQTFKLKKMPLRSPPCCLCLFGLPGIKVTKKRLIYQEWLIIATVFIKTVIAVISLALLVVDAPFSYNGFDTVVFSTYLINPYSYLRIISIVIKYISFYILIIILRVDHKQHFKKGLLPKFFVAMASISILEWHTFFPLLANFGVITCRKTVPVDIVASEWVTPLVIANYLLIVLAARYAFRKELQGEKLLGEGSSSWCSSNRNSAFDDFRLSTIKLEECRPSSFVDLNRSNTL